MGPSKSKTTKIWLLPKTSKVINHYKKQYKQNAKKLFSGTKVNITVSEAKHAKAVIGSLIFRKVTSDRKLISGANNSTFFQKLLSVNLKQHNQITSVD